MHMHHLGWCESSVLMGYAQSLSKPHQALDMSSAAAPKSRKPSSSKARVSRST